MVIVWQWWRGKALPVDGGALFEDSGQLADDSWQW